MRPDNRDARLAPINDQLAVVPPETIALTIAATIELNAGYSIDQAVAEFVEAMELYTIEAAEDGEIKYSRVYSLLSKLNSINDHAGLTVNGGTMNIAIANSEIPTVKAETVAFIIGTI